MRFPFGNKDHEKAQSGQEQEYTREKSRYEKGEGEEGKQRDDESLRISSPEDPEALSRLREDPEVRMLMEQAMEEGNSDDRESIQSMLGKGVSTLARSIKKASRGDGDLLDGDHEDEKHGGK